MAGEVPGIVRRCTLLFWLVMGSAALMAFELVSGIILWFILPSGQGWRSSSTATSLGLDRHAWIDLHNWAALMLTAIVVVHVAMHWRWVARQSRVFILGRGSPKDVACEAPGDTT